MRHLVHWTAVILLTALAAGSAGLPSRAPELRFHFPDELSGLAAELERYDRTALLPTLSLVGLEDPGPPIPVHLVREGSGAARRAPSWGVAYATGGQVVLIPSRVPGYPDRKIETVLHHEVAHVLIDRAAGGRPVPRWFHEGLALYAARDWGIEDRSRILWATLRGRESTLAILDRRFAAGAHSAARAYAFSAAFVRFLVDRFDAGAPAAVLERIAAGSSFEDAFLEATGASLPQAEADFFRHLDFWNKWVPFLTSSTTLWILITVLALYAFKRRRDKDAAIRDMWDAEEQAAWLREQPTNRWIH